MSINVRELAESVREYMIGMRREFHMYPEIGLEEWETLNELSSQVHPSRVDSLSIPVN